MADNDFLDEIQDKLTDIIWKFLIWALVATFGWGVKTALQVNELASVAKESTSEVRELKSNVQSLSLRLTILETKLESSSVNK
jgi:protein involved in temperature-dependent protein secretion